MVIRMFEYGFNKGREILNNHKNKNNKDEIKTIYFPKQRVIFFEENKNINDILKLRIVFPDTEEVIYSVPVLKYWEYTDEDLIRNKMYPLLPLQLFTLRKELENATNKNDLTKIQELSPKAKSLATKIAHESKELLEKNEIFYDDFHKMLLAIQNLIEYLNRNFLNDDNIEEEVSTVTKTLYDPEVEKRGIEKGIEKGIEAGEKKKAIEIAKNLLDVLDSETIATKTGLSLEEVENLRK